MGAPIGVAKDMAKLNEENLSRLSRPSMFEKLKSRGSKSKGKVYLFKESTPELILEIKNRKLREIKRSRKKQILIFLISIPITIGGLYLLVGLLQQVFFI